MKAINNLLTWGLEEKGRHILLRFGNIQKTKLVGGHVEVPCIDFWCESIS